MLLWCISGRIVFPFFFFIASAASIRIPLSSPRSRCYSLKVIFCWDTVVLRVCVWCRFGIEKWKIWSEQEKKKKLTIHTDHILCKCFSSTKINTLRFHTRTVDSCKMLKSLLCCRENTFWWCYKKLCTYKPCTPEPALETVSGVQLVLKMTLLMNIYRFTKYSSFSDILFFLLTAYHMQNSSSKKEDKNERQYLSRDFTESILLAATQLLFHIAESLDPCFLGFFLNVWHQSSSSSFIWVFNKVLVQTSGQSVLPWGGSQQWGLICDLGLPCPHYTSESSCSLCPQFRGWIL